MAGAGSGGRGEKSRAKFTILDVRARFEAGEPFTMLTAYDYSSAKVCEDAGVDMILVGDSLAQTMLGHGSTNGVTMDMMVHHAKAVAAGAKSPFLVGDMPFGSYEVAPQEAIANAIRYLAEGGMDGVKMEGGVKMAATAKAIVDAGVPVVGHIGLTPQTSSSLGGYRVQGRTAESAKALLADALAMQDAGCFAIVLEALPQRVASYIVSKLSVPTIGIGAGPHTAGQVLVYHDMLGLFDAPVPKFCKQYAQLRHDAVAAVRQFKNEVAARAYPGPEHCYKVQTAELRALVGDDMAVRDERPPPAASTLRVALGSDGGGGPHHAVWVVDEWAAQIQRIQADGLSVIDAESGQKETVTSVAATVPKGVPGPWMGPRQYADVVVVAVKQRGTAAAAALAAKLLAPDGGLVLTLQNGLGHVEQLADALPSATIVQGVMEGGATLRHGTSTVVQNGRGPLALGIAQLGEGGNTTRAAREVATLERMLAAAGLDVSTVEDIEARVWAKLMVNAAINPVTAVLGRKNGVIAKSARARELVQVVVAEASAVAEARGIKGVDPAVVVDHVVRVANNTFENTSSMLADVRRGVETEVDAINGAIVREGAAAGVPTPVNALLCTLVGALGEPPLTKSRTASRR
ncbi:2-dehydropantoate 2-reductase [Thecamonas trahens ATCC 50062]|uniref:3-methyl-2-oxobutanoate hydroxymethyltransferase n=1 Tax=Thecamonas trahens ATCC 50062 TaxID=461836 RepID=A0A0L0D5W3_THETB|nr:2-dehydropantoate 2-reductase [Thecamonas trahens ATCC 50062]KNC46698.1 2-dehydropantoate 2-reductase [Thecamonas trahens ATCC 50062]|eukprot:XP_013760464.1 2-dehydropantoate 2-reductase [Thecamonas trahens ATCC 50062]